MSDTEQNKKRKIEEVAAAAAAGDAPAPAADATTTPAAPATAAVGPSTAPENDTVAALQLAKEKQRMMKLLEPFPREQLIAILASAAAQFPPVYEELKAVASADVAHRKIFVRGLAWETDSDALQRAFGGFGAVDEAAVIYDKVTNKSKGFGFVTFSDMEAAQRACEQQHVDIDGRRSFCNLAALRANQDDHHGSSAQTHRPSASPAVATHGMYPAPMQQAQPMQSSSASSYSDETERKLFVRGLSWNTTDDLFHAEFSKFGELEEAMIARDRETGKSKGFGFITYRHKASADLALQQPQKFIDGRTTHCNLASQGSSRGSISTMGTSGGYGSSAMAPMMAGGVPAYGMPMYAAMPGQYGVAPQQQAPVQYGAYAADPYQQQQQQQQSYGAVAPQYYQSRPPGQ